MASRRRARNDASRVFGKRARSGLFAPLRARGPGWFAPLPALFAGLGAAAFGCSAHDVVKPNVDDAIEAGVADAGGGTDGADADPGTPSADCNLSGIWISKMVTVTQALNVPQYANNWYYLEIDQPAGSAGFTVTKEFDCGIEVRGSVIVTLLPPTLEAHMKHNAQVGRKGTITKNAAGQCILAAEPYWGLLGAADRFLPPRDTAEEIPTVAMRLPLPTIEKPDGAEDWDNDGKLGLGWQVSGVLQGSRSTVQRQWNRWFTTDRYAISPAMNWGDVTIGVDFDKDETVFDPTSGLLVSPSYSVRTPETPNRYTLRFLGRDKTDPRASGFLHGTDPFGDTAATVETCHAMQDTMLAEDM